MIDDVTVFTGSALLPAFSPEQVHQFVEPLANTGIRVDRNLSANEKDPIEKNRLIVRPYRGWCIGSVDYFFHRVLWFLVAV